MKKLYYFFYVASRGYSLPTSLTGWLVCFAFCLQYNANILNGLVAAVGITCAHLGTNLFDDCIDTIAKVPKQKCKTEYLDKNIFSLKFIIITTLIYFFIAGCTGLYLTLKIGIKVPVIAFITAIIILLYPRLNHYALGEAAVMTTYGPLLFAGTSLVMTGVISANALLVSIPVALLITNLLFVHSIMDYPFDKENNKKTLSVRLGNPYKSLYVLAFSGLLATVIHLFLVIKNILPIFSVLAIIPIILYYIPTIKQLKIYIKASSHQETEFMQIFKLPRNASMLYNLILTLTLIIQ